MKRKPGSFSSLLDALKDQLQQEASFETFQDVYPLLLGLFEERANAFENIVLPLFEPHHTRFPSHLRCDYEGMILDLLDNRLPIATLNIVSTLQMGPALTDLKRRQQLAARLAHYPAQGPTVEGVRWRMPRGKQPEELPATSFREPALSSPLLRELRIFDASQSSAFVSVFRHREEMQTVGDDKALGFTLFQVVDCSPKLEVINLYGEIDSGSMPHTWRTQQHRLSKVLRAINLGGGEPLAWNQARELVQNTAVEALFAKPGRAAQSWESKNQENPYEPAREWTREQQRAIKQHLKYLEYGYTGASPLYEPFPPTDWNTHFGPTSTPSYPWLPTPPSLAKKSSSTTVKTPANQSFDLQQGLDELTTLLDVHTHPFENDLQRTSWTQQVLWLLRCAHQQNPEHYRAQWIPFLEKYTQIWEQTSLSRLGSASALERWADLAPFARFGFVARGQAKTIEELSQSKALPQVRSLYLYSSSIQPNELMETLLTAELQQLRELTLDFSISDNVFAAMTRSPYLSQLTTLHIHGKGKKWLRNLATSTALTNLQNLRLTEPSNPEIQALANAENFKNLQSLRIYGLDTAGVRQLTNSPNLSSLRSLSLDAAEKIEPRALSDWLCSPQLANLTHVTLNGSGNDCDMLALRANLPSLTFLHITTGYQSLPEAPLLQQAPLLRNLELKNFHKAPPAPLANCEHLAHIERLDIGGNRLGFKGVVRLLSSPHLGMLQELNLDRTNQSKRASTKPFAKLSSLPPNLRKLCLSRNEISDETIEGLVACEALTQLTELDLQSNPLSPEGIKKLAKCPYLSGLTVLSLSQTGILTAGIKALAKSTSLRGVTSLNLTSGHIEDKGLTALLKSEICLGIKRLVLSHNDLTDKAARALAKCKHLTQLEHLDLSHNQIGEAGLKALAKSPYLTNLRSLQLWPNAFAWKGTGTDALFHSEYLPWPVRLQWAHW